MKPSDLFQFRIRGEHIKWILKRLNDDLEKTGASYRVTWHTAYGAPHLRICRAENFDKEHLYCSIVTADIPFSTRRDLLNTLEVLRYIVER